MFDAMTDEFFLVVSGGLVEHIRILGNTKFCIYFVLLDRALKRNIKHQEKGQNDPQRGVAIIYLSELAALANLSESTVRSEIQHPIFKNYFTYKAGARNRPARFQLKKFKTWENFRVIHRGYVPPPVGKAPPPLPRKVPHLEPWDVDDEPEEQPPPTKPPPKSTPPKSDKDRRAKQYAQICLRFFYGRFEAQEARQQQFEYDRHWYQEKFNEDEWAGLNLDQELEGWESQLSVKRHQRPGSEIVLGTVGSLRKYLNNAQIFQKAPSHGKIDAKRTRIEELVDALRDDA